MKTLVAAAVLMLAASAHGEDPSQSIPEPQQRTEPKFPPALPNQQREPCEDLAFRGACWVRVPGMNPDRKGQCSVGVGYEDKCWVPQKKRSRSL